ncbi:hypothetical protein COB72_05815 [bacterium]|nr:MAG: hypothetical protein COB72_05815 [bacterium]
MYAVLSAIIFIAMVVTISVVIRDASKQSPGLLSVRNLFLMGLFVFQFTSGIIALLAPALTDPYMFSDRVVPGAKFTFMLLLFTAGFMWIYRSGFIANTLVFKTKMRSVHVTWPKLCTLSLTFLVLGAVFRLGLSRLPYVGIYSIELGASFFALATGLAAWAWVPRLYNPIPMFIAAVVVLGGLGILFADSFGRRDMLGIVLAFIWGAYYSSWRYISFRKLIFRFSIISVCGVFFLAAYTSTRFNYGIEISSPIDRVKVLAEADILQGTTDLFSGQSSALYSMYFLDTRPDRFEYDTLHSLKLFFVLPIPRKMWREKPNALALTSVSEINDAGRPKGWNIGPGLIGHCANDNPYIALPLYTLILAVFFRFIDGLLSRHSLNPFVVLPMGVALGQIIAIPRGELGNFFGKTVLYLVGSWIAMQIVARLHQMVSPNSSMLSSGEDDEWDESAYESSYYEYDDDERSVDDDSDYSQNY